MSETELRQFSDTWAYDIASDVKKTAEIYNEDVINQSIQNILMTVYGERFFNPAFGSSLSLRIFDIANEDMGEKILDDIVQEIKRWEDRITIIESDIKMTIIQDENAILLDIPYIVNKTKKESRFTKKIIA